MTRTDVLNIVASVIGAQRYLEIGVRNPIENFDRVQVPEKVGIDPAPLRKDTLRLTSDAFFTGPVGRFDLIFIDGDHHEAQNFRDLDNALLFLEAGGFVVMHDCHPLTAAAVAPEKPPGNAPWNGQAYRVFLDARQSPGLRCVCADCDHGCGIITPVRGFGCPGGLLTRFEDAVYRNDFAAYLANAADWLGLVPPEDVEATVRNMSRLPCLA